MKIKNIAMACAAAMVLATMLLPTSAEAEAEARSTISHTRLDAVSEHAARVAAENIVTAETEVWRTGDLTAAKSLAVRTPESRYGAIASAETLDKVLQRAAMLRKTVTDSGFKITGYRADEDYRLATREGRTVVEVTVIRRWVETDTVTSERTDVGDTDVFRIPLQPEIETPALSAPTIEIATEGEQTASESGATTDMLTVSAESETTKPLSSMPEDPEATNDTVGAAAKSFNYTAFASYGKKWTASPYNGDKKGDFNSNYPYFKNNCANFISQMYNKGGWKRTGGVNPRLDGNWDDDLSGPAGPSRTWSQAKELYKYAKNKKGLKPLANIWNAAPGNTYFMDWDGNRVINHVTAVTARTSGGTPRISQKTANRHNMLLTTWKAKVDSGHPKVKWYGLRRTT